MLFLKRNSR